VLDIAWFDERADVMTPDAWQDVHGRRVILRRAVPIDETRVDVTLLLINGSFEDAPFRLPTPRLAWQREIDSADPLAAVAEVREDTVQVAAHSVVLITAIAAIERAPEGAPEGAAHV